MAQTGGATLGEPVLATELETFARHKAELLATAKGKFALVHGTEVAGAFETEGDAISQGYHLYGNVPFLVKRVLEVEQAANFVPNVIGL
jgi:hypothetical protein